MQRRIPLSEFPSRLPERSAFVARLKSEGWDVDHPAIIEDLCDGEMVVLHRA